MIDPQALFLSLALWTIWHVVNCIYAFGDYNQQRHDAYLRGVELVNRETIKHSIAMQEAGQAVERG